MAVLGSIVTIDAMGTKVEIAQKIIENGADYILSVKGNQQKRFAKQVKKDTSKGSLVTKRLKAGWDNKYLMQILNQI